MWQFEVMSHAAVKVYLSLPDVGLADKIALGQKYDFPREHLLETFREICTRRNPLSVEEGQKIELETLALIAQTREEIKYIGQNTQGIITNNLIKLQTCYYYR